MVVFIHALRGFRSSFSHYGEKETADDVQRHPLFVYIDVVKLQIWVRWLQVINCIDRINFLILYFDSPLHCCTNNNRL